MGHHAHLWVTNLIRFSVLLDFGFKPLLAHGDQLFQCNDPYPVDKSSEESVPTEQQVPSGLNEVGLEVVAKDNEGKIKAIWIELIHKYIDVELAEASSMRMIMIKAKEEGYDDAFDTHCK
ncbi:hypothetical protein ACH5RR_032273 [Cinchona calisaya]|uniref:Uncharacterized protein n=1 Tax=Cinchona calisaya TaxID=153742 RepID=A0ABD2YJK5_9GENT